MLITRALAAGLGYGAAVTIMDLGAGLLRFVDSNMPSRTLVTVTAGMAEITLGGAIGLLLAPLIAAGWLAHLLGMAVLWSALGWWLALDPSIVRSWLMAPAGGLMLALIGCAIARWRQDVALALAATGLLVVTLTPTLIDALRTRARPPAVATEPVRENLPNVVVVVLDTVRAANMSAYGYGRPTTPFFARLAETSALFLNATAPSTWSLPSHASLFTGRFPSGHDAHGEHRYLTPEWPTIAGELARAGYDTRCFTANPHISDSFGLTHGFAWQDHAYSGGGGGAARGFVFVFRLLDRLGLGVADKGGSVVAENFAAFIRSDRDVDRPFFAFLNFLEAHFPYHQLPEKYRRRFTDLPETELQAASHMLLGAQFGRRLSDEEQRRVAGPGVDMYDGGVLYTDSLLERVVGSLGEANLLGETILVVLADHGELLGEDGSFGHGPSLHELDLHVPLLLRYPPRVPAGVRVGTPVSTVGVFATILGLADLDPPPTLQVGSLLPVIAGHSGGAPVLAERFENPNAPPSNAATPILARRDRRYRTYRDGPWKLVQISDGTRLLFDLASDPAERDDRAAADPERLTHITTGLGSWLAELGLPPLDAEVAADGAPVLDPVVRDRLEALGYVD